MRDCGLDHDADDGRISDPSSGREHWSDDLCAIVAIATAVVFGMVGLWLWTEVILP